MTVNNMAGGPQLIPIGGTVYFMDTAASEPEPIVETLLPPCPLGLSHPASTSSDSNRIDTLEMSIDQLRNQIANIGGSGDDDLIWTPVLMEEAFAAAGCCAQQVLIQAWIYRQNGPSYPNVYLLLEKGHNTYIEGRLSGVQAYGGTTSGAKMRGLFLNVQGGTGATLYQPSIWGAAVAVDTEGAISIIDLPMTRLPTVDDYYYGPVQGSDGETYNVGIQYSILKKAD